MGKVRPLSIYLLKAGFNEQNALKDDHGLQGPVTAGNLPQNAALYLLDSQPTQPWWKAYFGITQTLSQVSKGALVFLPAGERCFALSFGHVYFNLKDTSYEYDFGLRVTLNCVDPQKLKSTDVLEPSEARRKTTQIPIESDLTYFDFDRDSNIIKRLTGKVKDVYRDLFVQVTGSSNLRISSKVASTDLPDICAQLLTLYESDEYKTTFPGIGNIQPVKDPQVIEQLNGKLLQALRDKEDNLALTVPDIINYEVNVFSCFVGCGKKYLYSDVFLGNYYQQLTDNNIPLTGIGIAELRHQKLGIANGNGDIRDEYSIFHCLVFDTHLSEGTECYHLCQGSWYKADENFITNLHRYLDLYYEEQDLPDYNHATESAYNEALAQTKPQYICLDCEDIRPAGQTQIEPCDLYMAKDGVGYLFHVKVSTLSASLSHLFNQGVNSVELIKLEAASKSKLKALISTKIGPNIETIYQAPIDEGRFKVVYAIVSRKDKNKKSLNLPLFSRISLMRSIKTLNLISGVKPAFCFISNISPKKPGKSKLRKKST